MKKSIIFYKNPLYFLIFLVLLVFIIAFSLNHNSFGIKYSENINNQKSPLLNSLINVDQFSSKWKFSKVHTYQAESQNTDNPDIASEYAFRTFIGQYKNVNIIIYNNVYKFSKNIPNDFITKAISNYYLQNKYSFHEMQYSTVYLGDNPEIYCYSEFVAQKSGVTFIGCDIFVPNEDVLKCILLEFDTYVSTEYIMEVLDSIH